MDSLGTTRRYEVYSYLEGNLNYLEKIQNIVMGLTTKSTRSKMWRNRYPQKSPSYVYRAI